jgi:O-antigen/teichoic acid export membrane protein
VPWKEAFTLAGVSASGLVLTQLDRLVIPHLLTLADLATYGVLAAIVGSPFRVLQRGVGYSLLPRLSAAPTVAARRRLIAHEARLVGAIVLAGSVCLWLVTPPIERWILAGKYHLGGSLVIAAIVAGVAKVLNAFSRATVTALADRRELALVNLAGSPPPWVGAGVWPA